MKPHIPIDLGHMLRRMPNTAHPESESLRLELQEAIVTFRHQTSMFTQIAGFLVTADSLLVAYGISQRIGIVLLIASIMPLIMLVVYVEILNSIVPLIYVAVTIEEKLGLREAPLARLYAQTYVGHIFNSISESSDMTDPRIRTAILGLRRRHWLTNRSAYALYAIFIAQIALFLLSILVFHYRFM